MDNGLEKKEFQEGADIYVINTCSVTENADRKCRKVVKEALKHNPNAFVAIIGCFAQLKPVEISQIPGVDIVLGAAEKFNLMEHLTDLSKREKATVFNENIKETNVFIPGFSAGDRTRTFLKVQDGCDYFCTFCTIPLARGKSRSDTIINTVKSAQEAAATGVKEIVLTGVNLGDFGVQNGETFYELIQELDKIEGVERFRISSIEPNLLSTEIIEFVAQSNKFVPHFHIPLQSGNDELLQKMRRKYLSNLYVDRVKTIKQLMPHCCIGVDVIVGFPGETEEHFLDTYNFLNELDVSYLHVFPYSERANTTAKKMDGVVPVKVRGERSEMLRILSQKKRRKFYDEHIGKTYTALLEADIEDGYMHGYTENYVRIKMPYDPLLVNELVKVKLTEVDKSGNVMVEEIYQEQLTH